MRWFPLVGMGIGGAAALLDAGLAPFVSLEVRSILIVVFLAAVTGGLHLDGLMDTCDGLLAFTTPERRLEIMRDSRVGSFAIVGLATALLLKYAAILVLPAPLRPAALVAMGGLSRWSMVLAIVLWPVAREEGLGHTYKQHARRVELLGATCFALLSIAPLQIAGLGMVVVALAITAALARYALGKIGGLTGDVYGAISEAVEIGVLVLLPPLVHALL